MGQLNIHMTPEFEKELAKFMKDRNISTKSSAIRIAIKEGIENAAKKAKTTDFSTWAGMANSTPVNKNSRFNSDDDLWK